MSMLKQTMSWLGFFAAIIVLTYLPSVVVWLWRGVLVFMAFYVLEWLWRQARLIVVGADLVALPRPRRLARLVTMLWADGPGMCHGDDGGGQEESPPVATDRATAREDRRRVRGLTGEYGGEAVLQAALQQTQPAGAVPADIEDRVKGRRQASDALCERLAGTDGAELSEPDRRFVRQALLVYEAGPLEKLLKRDARALGSKARRRGTAKMLQAKAPRTPWVDALADLGLFVDRPAPAGKGAPAPARRPGKMVLASVLFPAAAYAMAGQTARGALLGVTALVLLGYSLFALDQGRSVGWVFLAVWGLFHLLGMFSVYDLEIEPGT